MNIVFEISNTILLYCIQYLPNPNREHESHYKSTKEPGNRNKYVNKEKKKKEYSQGQPGILFEKDNL